MLSALGRPRRGVRAAAHARRPHRGGVLAAVRRDEAARDRFDPSDAGELWDLVNRQDWAVCESVQRGMSSRATGTAGSRRWRTTASTSAAGCCRCWGAPAGLAMSERVDYVVAGLGALGSAAAMELARRGHSGDRARPFRARALARREPRHQPDPAAQLPHAGLRAADPGGVRRLGAARARHRQRAGDHVGGLDLFPPERRSHRRLHHRPRRGRHRRSPGARSRELRAVPAGLRLHRAGAAAGGHDRGVRLVQRDRAVGQPQRGHRDCTRRGRARS